MWKALKICSQAASQLQLMTIFELMSIFNLPLVQALQHYGNEVTT